MRSILKISTTVSVRSLVKALQHLLHICGQIHLHQALITHFNSNANLQEVQDISTKQNFTANPCNTIKLGKIPHQGLVTTLRTHFVWIECLIRALQVVPSAFITYLWPLSLTTDTHQTFYADRICLRTLWLVLSLSPLLTHSWPTFISVTFWLQCKLMAGTWETFCPGRISQ